MKLFMIVYIAGKMGLIVGPITTSFEDCQDHAEQLINAPAIDDLTAEGLGVAISCEYHDSKPEIEVE